MNIESNSLVKQVLSYSFVLAWAGHIDIPILDQKFAKDIFNDPFYTELSLTANGLTISKENAPIPRPTVVLATNRLQITHTSLEKLEYVTGEILKHLALEYEAKYSNAFLLGIGVNFEAEIEKVSDNTEFWLSERFYKPDLFSGRQKAAKLINAEIELENGEFLGFKLEPRLTDPRNLYTLINHHHTLGMSDLLLNFDTSKIEGLYIKAFEVSNSELFDTILGS